MEETNGFFSFLPYSYHCLLIDYHKLRKLWYVNFLMRSRLKRIIVPFKDPLQICLKCLHSRGFYSSSFSFFLNSFLCCIFSCEMYLKLIQWDRLFFRLPWILPCSLLCTVINEITTNKQSRLPTGQALWVHLTR